MLQVFIPEAPSDQVVIWMKEQASGWHYTMMDDEAGGS
jgi:hypothetical protein